MKLTERRNHARHKSNYNIEVRATKDGAKACPVTLCDISDGGVSFRTENGEDYHIGQHLEVGITQSADGSSVVAIYGTATIAWIDHEDLDGSATVGVYFDQLIESIDYI